MTTDYVPRNILEDILRFLTPENQKVMRFLLQTGMRISDALAQPYVVWYNYYNGHIGQVMYIEQKTGKSRVVAPAREELGYLGFTDGPARKWLFPGRDPERPRTRQAVWGDLHRVCKLYRVNGAAIRRRIGTHTARKVYAVEKYRATRAGKGPDPLKVVQHDLNHKDPLVTMLYALADEITVSHKGERI